MTEMIDASAWSSGNGSGYSPRPSVDYVQDLESVGLALCNWRIDPKTCDDRASDVPLVYRSWSDQTTGIFGTDTGSNSVEIEAEATEDLLALGIPLGDEHPVFHLGNSPFSGHGLDIFCLPRGSRLQMSTYQKGLRSVALLIQIDALPRVCDTVDREFPALVRRIQCERMPFSAKASLPIAIRRTAEAVIGDSPSAAFERLYRRAKMAELLWLVMDHLRRTDFGSDGDNAISSREWKGIERVRRRIEEDSGRNVTTEQLSRTAGMNRTKLRSLFKRVNGVTMFEYRQAIIMKNAEEMLRHPNFTIAEIGYRLGYREPSSFSIAYKRFYGHAPGEIRRAR
jgi:AraC-like DNA-binding protein